MLSVSSWLGVELRHLAALAAVAEQQSFRGAADSLGYVQSAVSQRIAQLEQIVGARLIVRSRGQRHVELTDAGRALLHHAERIEAQLNAARADLRSLTHGVESPSLSIGVYGSLSMRVLPQALTLLADRFPELRVEAREALSDESFFADTQSGELDAAFGELPLEPGPFEWRELLVDQSVLVVPAGSPLARPGARPTLREIAGYPMVAYRTWRMFTLIETRFAAAGVELDARFAASSQATVQALVGAGLGVAIMPRSTVDPDDPATEIVDVEGMMPTRTWVCFWSRDRRRRPALDAFIEAVEAVCAALAEYECRTIA
jgi:DNA-binding transcriptional LysR family regulator